MPSDFRTLSESLLASPRRPPLLRLSSIRRHDHRECRDESLYTKPSLILRRAKRVASPSQALVSFDHETNGRVRCRRGNSPASSPSRSPRAEISQPISRRPSPSPSRLRSRPASPLPALPSAWPRGITRGSTGFGPSLPSYSRGYSPRAEASRSEPTWPPSWSRYGASA